MSRLQSAMDKKVNTTWSRGIDGVGAGEGEGEGDNEGEGEGAASTN